MSSMRLRRLAWLLTLPLTVLGSVLAHSLSYRIVAPEAPTRAQLLADSGHAYLAYAPAVLALATAAALLALAGQAAAAARGPARARVAAWPFATLPLLSFALQEHLERLARDGSFPAGAALEPTFLVGVALMLPLAVLALAVARVLLAVSAAIGCALGEKRAPSPRPAPLLALSLPETLIPRLRPLPSGAAGRAPPLLA